MNISKIEQLISKNSHVKDVKVKLDRRTNKATAYIVANTSTSSVINGWKAVFDDVYEKPEADREFNILGWNSSFTGLPIAADEMKEWVDNTVYLITDLLPNNIYEIGCGTGLLLFPLQQVYKNYIGVDISKTAIDSINHQIHEKNIKNTKVFTAEASDFSHAIGNSIDTIVINSVSQLFPSIDYFLNVIEQSINIIKGKGKIFIGDILNFNTIENFHTLVQLNNKVNGNKNITELLDIVENKITFDSMLYISPEIFLLLKEKHKEITDVKISLKPGYSQNEMTKYRYDVVLSINSDATTSHVQCIETDWLQDEHDIQWFEQLISKKSEAIYHIKNISNARIPINIEKIYEIDFYNKSKTIYELESIIFESLPGIDPGQIIDLCKKYSKVFNVYFSRGKNGEFDICIYPDDSNPSYCQIFEKQKLSEYSSYCNKPHQSVGQCDFIIFLKSELLKHFPTNEIPDDFIIVDEISDVVKQEIILNEDLINTIPSFVDTNTFNYCLHELFEQQANKTPSAIAISFDGECLTYCELNEQANQLANFLLSKEVEAGNLVGIMLERSITMIVAILATLKCGAAYVPLDPQSPQARTNYILQDAEIKILICDKPGIAHCSTIVDISNTKIKADIKKHSNKNISSKELQLNSGNLAYVIYTSGSTGNPKGVLVEHKNVIHLFNSTKETFAFSENDAWTLFHSFAFDFSVWEIWGALLFGGRLIIVPQWIAKDTSAFYELVSREKITVLNQTPSAFYPLISIDAQKKLNLVLRLVIFGGEALSLQALDSWINRHGDEKIQLVNMYGITETTVHVTYQKITANDVHSDSGSIIGKPIDNMHIVLLNDSLDPVSSGEIGEAWIGGNGVTRGYLHQPLLTKERFIDAASSSGKIVRLYKTGDLLRETPSGTFEYIGRADQQVKIRGFRIELREIESTFLKLNVIQDAVVMVKENVTAGKQLVAYFVKKPELLISDEECEALLKAHARKNLPEYMIPSHLFFLEKIPLTDNGKIDKNVLTEINPSFYTTIDLPAFENEIDQSVYQLIKDLLGIQQFKMSDSFFDLGGHSLLAARVIAQINYLWNIDITLRRFFELKSIKDISNYISNSCTSENSIEIEI